jgi:Hsp70 protein
MRSSTALSCPLCHGSIDSLPSGATWVKCPHCGEEMTVTSNRSQLVPDFGIMLGADDVPAAREASVLVLFPDDEAAAATMPGAVALAADPTVTARVVIAIDFGTARSGYAFAFLHDRRIIKRTAWPDQPFQYAKTSTNLLCNPGGHVESWGFTARKEMARLRRENRHHGYCHLTGFKVGLRKGETSPDGPILHAGERSFPVVKLVADYLRQLKQFALQELQGGTSGLLAEHEVSWCLTIPAIWSDAEKHWMRVAAEEAGMIEAGADPSRLRMVLEPEAAALHCLEQELGADPDLSQLKPGTRFMIVDAGGGTVDITVHEVEKDGLALEEVIPGAGSMHGAMEVDAAFRRILEAKLGADILECFRNDEPYAHVRLMDEWEQAKCNYRPGMGMTFVPLGAELYRLLSSRYPAVLDRLRKTQNGDEFNLHFDQKTLEKIFDATLTGVVDTVRGQFDKLADETCDYLFLVGGFANSVFLQQRIKEAFAERVLKIIIPPDPGAAVLTGAVSYGLNPSRIRARRARLTYGCRVMAPFEKGVDPESKKRRSVGRKDHFCRDRFKPFVQAGDAVAVNHEVIRTFRPSAADQTEWTVVFYASAKKSPRYTDEEGVQQIGTLVVKLPDTTGGIKRAIQVAMRFGRTEIEVRAGDVNSGKQTEATLSFSGTYHPEE